MSSNDAIWAVIREYERRMGDLEHNQGTMSRAIESRMPTMQQEIEALKAQVAALQARAEQGVV